MTSTYVSYRLYSQDIPSSLARTAAGKNVSRDIAYYQDNIGKVTSVEQFLDDRRLFAVAMKAHGLEDMTFARAFMRKVLESNLSDSTSFARQLADPRYAAFARAFNFTPSGGVTQSPAAAQSSLQEDDTVELYSEHRIKQSVAAAAEATYYQSEIGTLTSVDQLTADDRLLAFALTSVGLDPAITSDQYVRDVLTSNLGDPQSLANTTTDARFRALAAAFSFATDGSVAPGQGAQSASQLEATVYEHYVRSGNAATPAAAAHNATYYGSAIAAVTTVDDLIGNDRLLAFALTAFGIDASTASKPNVRAILTSDLDDPQSPANTTTDARYRALRAAFNFATDGTVSGSDGAQSAAQLDTTIDGYLAKYDDSAETAEAAATKAYRAKIDAIASVDEFLKNASLYTYALEAFGLDPSVELKSKIRQVLTSDLSNPASFARNQSDKRYRELAAAFNFAPNGKAQQVRRAQSGDDEQATITLYNATVGSSEAAIATGKRETAYYRFALQTAVSVDGLLADKRAVAYLTTAFALDTTVSKDTLRRALTSDPTDPESFVNRKGQPPELRQLAAAFNFDAKGNTNRLPAQAAQTRRELIETTDAYVRQTMESDAGDENEGVRLALYFERKALTINSALSILADKALLKVAQTALGLPVSMSQAALETQEAMIEKRLDVADLKDPAKLAKFLARFSALYDIENGSSAAVSPATIILGGGSAGVGTNAGLLAALQNLKF